MAKKTQEVEEKDQEVSDGNTETEDEQDEYGEAFEDATSDSDVEDKKSKEGSGTSEDEKEEESSREESGADSEGGEEGKEPDGEESEKETEGEKPSDQKEEDSPEIKEAQKKVEEAIGKLPKDKEAEEEEEEPPPKPKKKAVKAKKPPPEEEDDLGGVDLTDEEQTFLEDYPEVKGVSVKIARQMIQEIIGEDVDFQAFMDRQEKLEGEIATYRSRSFITKRIPDWEDIVFDGDKMNEDGSPVLNPEFWGWLDKQPSEWHRLATSANPSDNVVILRYYKEKMGQDKKNEIRKKTEEKLKKTKDTFGNQPESGNIPKRKAKGGETFDEIFDEIT